MALAFVACDSAAGTLPDDGNKDTTPTPDNKPSDTKKPHTEEDAKTALVAMTAQLGTKKNFAADLTITVGTKQNGVNGGYLLTASVDVKDFLNAILSMMQNLLQVSPKTIAAQYLTGEALATIGEMTVSDVLTLIDGYIGEERTDAILEIVMNALASATTETDGTDQPAVSEVRAAFLSMFGDSKVIALILGFAAGDDDSAPAYDPGMTEEQRAAFYEALAEALLGKIPDEEIGKITVPGTEMTIGDLLKGVAFTDCHASVTFTLTDTYLPTAVKAEASVAILKTPKATYAYQVTAEAALSFDANVTLPEEMPILPVEDTYRASAEGDNLTVSVSYFSDDFRIASATIVCLNGEAVDIKATVDEETKTITFTGIPQAYIDGEAQIMTFDIEVVFTRTVGERTYTYTLLRSERYQPVIAGV